MVGRLFDQLADQTIDRGNREKAQPMIFTLVLGLPRLSTPSGPSFGGKARSTASWWMICLNTSSVVLQENRVSSMIFCSAAVPDRRRGKCSRRSGRRMRG